jgi:hypothetical protein
MLSTTSVPAVGHRSIDVEDEAARSKARGARIDEPLHLCMTLLRLELGV